MAQCTTTILLERRSRSGDEIDVLGVGIDVSDVRRTEEEKREFYRETIRSVTNGKLDITDRAATQCYVARSGITQSFANPAELSHFRRQAQAYCASRGLDGDPLAFFVIGVGEAMTNALKHASGGQLFRGSKDDQLWVGVSDTGMGIATLTLPQATLLRGYSTKTSMGMGYSIMLEVADRVMLSTGPEGTTVVMFKNLHEAKPEPSLDSFQDTWDAIGPPV